MRGGVMRDGFVRLVREMGIVEATAERKRERVGSGITKDTAL
jgi:hypothetical protein